MGSGIEVLRWKNGFRAIHWAKMSSQDIQVNTVGCIVLPKTKLNTLRPYTCAELHAHAHLPFRMVQRLLYSYEVYTQKRKLLLPPIYFRCYKTVKHYRSLVSTEYSRPQNSTCLKRCREYSK